jgi:hypothetical protein
MMLLLSLFLGFVLAFYLACWVLYNAIKKMAARDHLTHTLLLVLLAAFLFFTCWCCFKSWFVKLQ